jgi:hypothetical protein
MHEASLVRQSSSLATTRAKRHMRSTKRDQRAASVANRFTTPAQCFTEFAAGVETVVEHVARIAARVQRFVVNVTSDALQVETVVADVANVAPLR